MLQMVSLLFVRRLQKKDKYIQQLGHFSQLAQMQRVVQVD